MGWALGLDEGQVWGGCAELVTLDGVECCERKTQTNHCSDGALFGFEWGVECCWGLIVRFVLPSMMLEWS